MTEHTEHMERLLPGAVRIIAGPAFVDERTIKAWCCRVLVGDRTYTRLWGRWDCSFGEDGWQDVDTIAPWPGDEVEDVIYETISALPDAERTALQNQGELLYLGGKARRVWPNWYVAGPYRYEVEAHEGIFYECCVSPDWCSCGDMDGRRSDGQRCEHVFAAECAEREAKYLCAAFGVSEFSIYDPEIWQLTLNDIET